MINDSSWSYIYLKSYILIFLHKTSQATANLEEIWNVPLESYTFLLLSCWKDQQTAIQCCQRKEMTDCVNGLAWQVQDHSLVKGKAVYQLPDRLFQRHPFVIRNQEKRNQHRTGIKEDIQQTERDLSQATITIPLVIFSPLSLSLNPCCNFGYDNILMKKKPL